jgi:hypothetical protein
MRFTQTWPGEVVKATVAFADAAGAPVLVSGVTFTARDPAGNITHPAAVQGADASTWSADIAASASGTWGVRAECTGPTAAAVEASFVVRQSLVSP